MEDYPRKLMELERRFPDEEACRQYLFGLRWPEGFVCPGCGGRKSWMTGRGLWLCASCRRQVSVTAGTIFDRSRLPLVVWFRAVWQVTNEKSGASALSVKRTLGLGSYRTAWSLLQKLRRAMVRPGRDRLKGRIEIDETYWGAPEEGVVGRLVAKKTVLVVAAEEDGAGIGRIRMGRISTLTRVAVRRFAEAAIEPGSMLITDGLGVYKGLKNYRHEARVVAKSSKTASELLPRVHRVVSLLKRWLMGTHHGAVSREHLDYYLDEFTFRFNRRKSASRGKLFYRLLQQAVQVNPAPYKTLIKPQDMGGG